MKKTIYILSIVVLSISCNDNDVAPASQTSDAFLTKVSRNGVTGLELQYGIDEHLLRVNYYYLNKLALYHIYEYNGDKLKESRRYDAEDHSVLYRSVFTLDNFGRIIKGENYSKSDPNELASVNFFEYNSSGQLKSRELIFAGIDLSQVEEFSYDDENNLVNMTRVTHEDEDVYTSLEIDYTPGQQSIPQHWQEYIFLLWLSGHDEKIMYMFNNNVHYRFYNSNSFLISENDYETSGHVFDDAGNLTQITVTNKDLSSPQTPDEVFDLNYDFE